MSQKKGALNGPVKTYYKMGKSNQKSIIQVIEKLGYGNIIMKMER